MPTGRLSFCDFWAFWSAAWPTAPPTFEPTACPAIWLPGDLFAACDPTAEPTEEPAVCPGPPDDPPAHPIAKAASAPITTPFPAVRMNRLLRSSMRPLPERNEIAVSGRRRRQVPPLRSNVVTRGVDGRAESAK